MDSADSGKRHQEVSEGHRAQSLLENEAFVTAVDYLRGYYESAWKNSTPEATEGRERIWLMLRSLNAVVGHLETVVETGTLAKIQLEEDQGVDNG